MSKGRAFHDLLLENEVGIDTQLDGEVVIDVPLLDIKPNPFQPRKIFNEEKIDELAKSIQENGVFQPIIVKRVSNGYIIVSGERRFRACQKLGLINIPAISREYDESKVAEIALIENLQREDLSPVEEANAYKNIMAVLGLSQNDLAIKIGKSRSHITNMLGLLNLPDEVLLMMNEGKISAGHARSLSKLDSKERIILLAKRIIDDNLNVREIEDISRKEKKSKEIKRVKTKKYFKEEKVLKEIFNDDFKIDDKKIIIKTSDVKKLIAKLMGDKRV